MSDLAASDYALAKQGSRFDTSAALYGEGGLTNPNDGVQYDRNKEYKYTYFYQEQRRTGGHCYLNNECRNSSFELPLGSRFIMLEALPGTEFSPRHAPFHVDCAETSRGAALLNEAVPLAWHTSSGLTLSQVQVRTTDVEWPDDLYRNLCEAPSCFRERRHLVQKMSKFVTPSSRRVGQYDTIHTHPQCGDQLKALLASNEERQAGSSGYRAPNRFGADATAPLSIPSSGQPSATGSASFVLPKNPRDMLTVPSRSQRARSVSSAHSSRLDPSAPESVGPGGWPSQSFNSPLVPPYGITGFSSRPSSSQGAEDQQDAACEGRAERPSSPTPSGASKTKMDEALRGIDWGQGRFLLPSDRDTEEEETFGGQQ